jgi:hypothetical protein
MLLYRVAALPHLSRASRERLFSLSFKYKHELRAAHVYLIFSCNITDDLNVPRETGVSMTP